EGGDRRRRAGIEHFGIRAVGVRAVPRSRDRRSRGRRDDRGGREGNRRRVAGVRVSHLVARRARDSVIGGYLPAVRFVSTRGSASSAALGTALFDGLAPDGGLYVPDPIEPWAPEEINALPSMSLAEIGLRTLRPFARGIDARTLRAIVNDALDFPIPLVEVEPGIYSLELFHGPTLAFKDVGARVMARLMAALGGDVTVLTATSGDTGSAVAAAFHGIA